MPQKHPAKTKPKFKKPPRRPLLVLTRNGRVIARIGGPQGANDLRLVWGIPVLGGGGWWTKNQVRMKGGAFLFPPGVNDWHFFVTGVAGKGVPLVPPPWANDAELIWRGDRIVEVWWTLDGQRMEKVPLGVGSSTFHFARRGKPSLSSGGRAWGVGPLVRNLQEMLKAGALSNRDIIKWLGEASEWICVCEGDDTDGGRGSSDKPEQCVCGTDWMTRTAESLFNVMPIQKDIDALYSTIDYPKFGDCDQPCVPREIFKGKMWQIWKNNKTGRFKLYCSKRVQWHCEMLETPT